MSTDQPSLSTSSNADSFGADSLNQQQPSSPNPPSSPPFADAVVRPFTSQGSTSFTRPLTYDYPPPTRSSERPYTAQGTPNPPLPTAFGPYISASARTSYTRVDIDSVSPTMYPPLPSIPTASAELNPDATPTDVPINTILDNDSTEPQIPQTHQVSLTFLLVSGRRKTQSFDPETTVGRVKELVWNAWPARDAEWQDERPPAPSYLRILYLGKILQDDDTLLRVGFPTSLPSSPTATPTIVHLSIRPYAPPSEDPALSKKKRLSTAFGRRGTNGDVEDTSGDDAERAGCCGGCVIC